MGMAEFVKSVHYDGYDRLRLEKLIDDGHYKYVLEKDKGPRRYFYGRPPYQYTTLEPRNFMDGGATKRKENDI